LRRRERQRAIVWADQLQVPLGQFVVEGWLATWRRANGDRACSGGARIGAGGGHVGLLWLS